MSLIERLKLGSELKSTVSIGRIPKTSIFIQYTENARPEISRPDGDNRSNEHDQ